MRATLAGGRAAAATVNRGAASPMSLSLFVGTRSYLSRASSTSLVFCCKKPKKLTPFNRRLFLSIHLSPGVSVSSFSSCCHSLRSPCSQPRGLSQVGPRDVSKRPAAMAAAAAGAASVLEPDGEGVGGSRDGDGRIRIAIIGDVHGCWDEQRDVAALKALQPHLTLFVGDFGEENVELVGSIAAAAAALPPAAVMLGNHDAWFGIREAARGRPSLRQVDSQDRIQQQVAILGDAYVGWGRLDLPSLSLSVVGGRPFSYGGPKFPSAFFSERFGVSDFSQSADRIAECAASVPPHHDVILLAHNGPTELGEEPHDICGKDWGKSPGGDWGDKDLRKAMNRLHQVGRSVPMVAFGHMHSYLAKSHRPRDMLALCPKTRVTCVNAAVVPRLIQRQPGEPTSHHFVIVELGEKEGVTGGRVVVDVCDVWVEMNSVLENGEELLKPLAINKFRRFLPRVASERISW